MKSRIISPPLTELNCLRTKLTEGEDKVLHFFNEHLSKDWEIYIQPHLNGLRPDFVLLNPKVGIGVFEVKDWNLQAMRYFTKKDEDDVCSLWAEKDNKEFCIQKTNPVTQVQRYKKKIFDLYCPRLESKNSFAAITAGVIFPFAYSKDVKKLFEPFLNNSYPKYEPVSGIEELSSSNVQAIFPETLRKSSKHMSEDRAQDLRGWLVEPDFSSTQREPLVLDANQRSLAESRTETGYRRIKGPAGSGKSLVLAARAAHLANEGKSVLIATFNITLLNYLHDLVVRGLDTPRRKDYITFKNFHLWCKDVCEDVGLEKKYNKLMRKYNNLVEKKEKECVFNDELPHLAREAVNQLGTKRYDAILVDEGQDYRPHWWNALRKVCKPNGEMLLVADATQDIYDTAKAWTDDVMKGAGFSGGRWAQLKISYRMPPDTIRLARKFAETFLPEESIEIPEPEQWSLNFYPCHLRWVQKDPENAAKVCSDEILLLMHQTGKNNLANADITLLVSEVNSGEEIVKHLSEHHISVIHTFDKDKHRKQKMAFFMGNAKIKATTLHSFKGWESRFLVIYVTEAATAKSLALIYAGLTRLKRSQKGSWMTIVCSDPKLQNYGKQFPNHKIIT